MTNVAIGKPIPDFKATSTAGDISSSSFSNRWTVLYFYPKDNTPGCTNQAKGFRDHYTEFQKLNTEIIGVSRDSLRSHENFINKHELPFALISDPDEALCTLFDVIKLKNMYGKKVRGIERSTFLIGPDNTLHQEWRGLRVPGHVETVLQAVQDAQQ